MVAWCSSFQYPHLPMYYVAGQVNGLIDYLRQAKLFGERLDWWKMGKLWKDWREPLLHVWNFGRPTDRKGSSTSSGPPTNCPSIQRSTWIDYFFTQLSVRIVSLNYYLLEAFVFTLFSLEPFRQAWLSLSTWKARFPSFATKWFVKKMVSIFAISAAQRPDKCTSFQQ